jgi:NADH-quinone oxidoreductase subunit N
MKWIKLIKLKLKDFGMSPSSVTTSAFFFYVVSIFYAFMCLVAFYYLIELFFFLYKCLVSAVMFFATGLLIAFVGFGILVGLIIGWTYLGGSIEPFIDLFRSGYEELVNYFFDYISDICITFTNFFLSIYLQLPEFFLANAIIVLFLFGIFSKQKFKNAEEFFRYMILISKIIVLFTAILVLITFSSFNLFVKYEYGLNNNLFFWDQYSIDFFSQVFKLVLLAFFYFLLILLRSYAIHQRVYLFEYIILGFMTLLGGFLMISSFDFLLFYLVLELQALSFYVLAALNVKSKFSAEAGIKYFITGALASGFLLLGVAFLYGYTGTVNFYQLNLFFSLVDEARHGLVPILIFSILLILATLFIKLGVAPFHLWVPDVYQGSPFIITAFFAILPKISLFPFFLKFIYYVVGTKIIGFYNYKLDLYNFIFFGNYNHIISVVLLVVGFISILIGSLGALGQINLKRFFAFSSISNIGYTVIALGTNSIEGFEASLFYLFIYLVLSVNFFAIVFALRISTKHSIVNLTDLALVNSPYLLFLFSLNLFSLAGIPPLAGFYSKFYVYYVLISANFYFVTFCLAMLTVISTFYYIRIVAIIFFYIRQKNKIRTIFSIDINQYLPVDISLLIFITTTFNIFIFLELENFLLFLIKMVLLFF